jgi:peptidyl-prolyl cis-trans isomerase D
MITWMQRHKKYLIITIWISTIAFIGAGFVGWGQYSYGEKASAVAKVGDIEISQGDLQKEYSNIYAQYNQLFQGNFDEEKAKQFGLQRQALQQLTQRALLLNLAKEYDLSVSDSALLAEITTQKYFFKDGKFDKDVYKQVLSRNRLTMKEYETDLKKQLLVQKVLKFLPVKENANEKKIIPTLLSISDKISYKVLTPNDVKIKVTDALVKPFWEARKNDFMTNVIYKVAYIEQKQLSLNYDDKKIKEYYLNNKIHFKDEKGKILSLEDAKDAVVKELNDKSTKNQALRNYIAFKKEKLDAKTKVKNVELSQSHNIFNADAIDKLSKVALTSPYIKPIKVDDVYYILKLVKTIPAKPKSYAEAKKEVLPLYKEEMTKRALLKLAQNSLATFKGSTTKFIQLEDSAKLTLLGADDAKEFLGKLFDSQKKRDFVELNDGKIVLYNIMEQKLLHKKDDKTNALLGLKNKLFGEGMIKDLQNRYPTEIFIKGL